MVYVVDIERYLYLVPFVTAADGTRFLYDDHPERRGHTRVSREAIIVNDQLNPEDREILERFERGELPAAAGALSEIEAARDAAHKYLSGRPTEKR